MIKLSKIVLAGLLLGQLSQPGVAMDPVVPSDFMENLDKFPQCGALNANQVVAYMYWTRNTLKYYLNPTAGVRRQLMDRLPGIVRGLHTLAEPAHYVIIAQVAARIWPALVPTVDETIASQIWAQQVGPFRAALNAVLDSPRFQMLVQRLGVPAPAPAPVARLVPAEAVPLWVEILDHSFGLNRDGPLWCAPVLGKDLLARITALREYFPDEVLFRSLLLIARKLSRLQKTDDPRPLMTKFCARLPEVKELKEEAFAARIHLPSPIEAAAP